MLGLYPFKLKPVFKEKVWGGHYLCDLFRLQCGDDRKIGEAWLLSALEDNETIVVNGHFADNSVSELAEVFLDDFLGEEVFDKYETHFPLLVKLIDAHQYLSVQLHPDDEIARQKHGVKFGKSEMWYVLDAIPDAHIIAGFNKYVSIADVEKSIEQQTLENILNYIPVSKGDVIYLPAGLIHALGPGIVVLEIQQSADITYRLYDWGRLGDDGKPRELHVQDGLAALKPDLQPHIIKNFRPPVNETVRLLDTPYFSTSWITLQTILEKNLEIIDLFIVYVLLDGSCTMIYQDMKIQLNAGDCVLVPAIIEKLLFLPQPRAHLVEIVPC